MFSESDTMCEPISTLAATNYCGARVDVVPVD
jgi:hypothetical protein